MTGKERSQAALAGARDREWEWRMSEGTTRAQIEQVPTPLIHANGAVSGRSRAAEHAPPDAVMWKISPRRVIISAHASEAADWWTDGGTLRERPARERTGGRKEGRMVGM